MGWLLWHSRFLLSLRNPGTALLALTRNAKVALGLRMVGRSGVILLQPDLVKELLVTHSAETTKGPAVQRTRPLLGNGLLTSEGDEHRRARRLVGAAFAPSRLDRYATTIIHETRQLASEWRDGGSIDLHHEMVELTLRVVGRTLLGTDVTDNSQRIGAALAATLVNFGQRSLWRQRSDIVPAPEVTELRSIVDEIVEQRRRDPGDDVVSALIHASDPDSGGTLSDTEVRDQVTTLLAAGHETTANALSFTLHLLSDRPDLLGRLRAEVGLLPSIPTRDQLDELSLTRAIVTEAIRLYPPAWIFGRRLNTGIGFAGTHLPEGTVVGVSPWVLHRNPIWYPKPDEFDPDRWIDGRQADVPRYGYVPFGAGPRGCIGEQFAWLEAVAILATLLRDWDIARTDSQLRLDFSVTLRPRGTLPAVVRRRPESTKGGSMAAR
jgi:cytochrome P450